MEKKNRILISLLVFFLILAIIVIIIMAYNINITNFKTSNDEKSIIIEGTFSEGAVGYIYEFHKDGTLVEGDEKTTYKGTYKATGEKKLNVLLTEKIALDTETSKKNVEKINENYDVSIIDENTLNLSGYRNGKQFNFEIMKLNTNQQIYSNSI